MANIVVKVSTDELKAKAQDVQNQVDAFEKQWETLSEIVRKTKGYWVGEASNAHQKQLNEYKDDVHKIIKRLREHPVDLLKMANVYDEAEKKAVAVAMALPEDAII